MSPRNLDLGTTLTIVFLFPANLTHIVPFFEKMKESTDILWTLQGTTFNPFSGISYLSEVWGQGPVEFGEKSIWTIKIGKI